MSFVADTETRARANLESKVESTVLAFEHSLTEVANQPTVGHYFIREHTRQSIPAILQARNSLAQTNATAQGGSFAAQGGHEFASTLSTSLSQPTLDHLHQLLSHAQDTARSVLRERRQAQRAQQGARGSLPSPSAALRKVLSKGRER